ISGASGFASVRQEGMSHEQGQQAMEKAGFVQKGETVKQPRGPTKTEYSHPEGHEGTVNTYRGTTSMTAHMPSATGHGPPDFSRPGRSMLGGRQTGGSGVRVGGPGRFARRDSADQLSFGVQTGSEIEGVKRRRKKTRAQWKPKPG